MKALPSGYLWTFRNHVRFMVSRKLEINNILFRTANFQDPVSRRSQNVCTQRKPEQNANTELLYSHILVTNRGSRQKEISGVYTTRLLDRLSYNSLAGPKTLKGFPSRNRCLTIIA